MQNPKPYGPAAGPIFEELYKQPGVFAGALSNNYNSYAGGLANVGKSYADAFGAYGAGLGTMATARANENSARFGANAMAEAARQGALANVASSGLGAYGSAANSALNAWAANQQAYNRSAADMHMANQQAMGNVGVSRNNALGALGGSYGALGKAQIGADALSNLNFSMSGGGGGGFSATGPGGPIAGGSFGGGGGGGGFNFGGSSSRSSSGGMGGAGALAGLTGLRDSVMDADIPNRIDRSSQAGRDQLDAQHYSSRMMPSDMLGQTLSGLMTLSGPAYSNSNRGMDQFYANTQPNERAYESMLGSLNQNFGGVGQQIGGVQRDMTGGFGTANSGVNNLWDRTLGKSPEFQTPAEREIAARQGRLEAAKSKEMERLARLERLANDPSSPYQSYYARRAAAQRARMAA